MPDQKWFQLSVIARLSLITALGISVVTSAETNNKMNLFPELQKYVQQRESEFGMIPGERIEQLNAIAKYVKSRVKDKQPVRMTFICTHNSRRSHMSQIWAATAASYYRIRNVECFSGGTEATAFNPRAIAALKRNGLMFDRLTEPNQVVDGKNPKYLVRFRESGDPLNCFSKVYSDPPNPKDDFCAVMVCAQADSSCPVVKGCTFRAAIPYDDPKIADDTPGEGAKYDERSAQICREMLYLFSQVAD